MLVWIASYQRSGSTLTFRTLFDIYGINRFCSVHERGLWAKGWHRRPYEVPEELQGLRRTELIAALRERPEPFFFKSHEAKDSADPAPALYCVRDGRDALVSRAHWIEAKKVPPLHHLSFQRRLGRLVRSPAWSIHVRAWRTRSAPTALIRFEDLVRHPAATVKAAYDELGLPSLPEPSGELTPFEKLHRRNPTMYRRGVSGYWEQEMAPAVEERFWLIHGSEMAALGYERGHGTGEVPLATT